MNKEKDINKTVDDALNDHYEDMANDFIGDVICYGCGKSGADDKLEVLDYCPSCFGAGCVDCKDSGHKWQTVNVHKSCI